MRRFIITGLICLISAAVSEVSAQKSSALVFDNEVCDFGQIKENGGKVNVTFRFTNTGVTPVVIERVDVSCGCTSSQFSAKPVMPKGRGSITVIFDPEGRPGHNHKEVTVVSGGGKNINTLVIKADVKPRPRRVEDDYPVALGEGLRVDRTTVSMSQVGQGQAKSTVIRYVNTSNRELTLEVRSEDPEGVFTVRAPVRVAAGARGDITVTCDLSGKEVWGGLSADVALVVNGKWPSAVISVSATGVDDFGDRSVDSDRPIARARLDKQFHNFGDAGCGETKQTIITLRNDGDGPLTVRSVKAEQGVDLSLVPGMEIAPGASVDVVVRVVFPDYPTEMYSRAAYIVFNDPQRPVRTIRLTGRVVK